MSWHRCSVGLLLSIACSSEAATPVPAGQKTSPKPVAAAPTPDAPVASPDGTGKKLEAVYETMMMELADNIVRRTEEAAKHDYATLEEAKAALDEVLPQNSLGQLDAVLRENGINKQEMAAFMRDNPELVAKVGKKFEAKLLSAETDLAKVVAKVEALQKPPEGE